MLEAVRAGEVDPDDAAAHLRAAPYADLGFARVDHHRALRQGRPEAVYAPGKSTSQVVAIVGELLGSPAPDEPTDRAEASVPDRAPTGPIVLSRARRDQAEAALAAHPDGTMHGDPEQDAGVTVVWRARPIEPAQGEVVVASAGTADLVVADECAVILRAHGVLVRQLNDVGVAGLHRILDEVPALQAARAVVVVAGMEGALASVVGGLTGAPVVAVPTSVGYGSGLDGVTALLAMTASCASGITVVGIDNGFGAACAVLRMLATDDVMPADGTPPTPDASTTAGAST